MQLVPSQETLPTTIAELSKFVLVGREKLVAVRAEIRAIRHLRLAKEVENQKIEEARMVSEALLDAQTLIGDMTRNIQTASGGDRRGANFKISRGGNFEKTKREAIKELGLTQKQVHQFETLSKNKDLVELAKMQARENDDIPTRTQVLSMAEARKRRFGNDMQRIDTDYQTVKQYHDAIYGVLSLPDDLQGFMRGAGEDVSTYLEKIDAAIAKLHKLGAAIRIEKGRCKNATREIPR